MARLHQKEQRSWTLTTPEGTTAPDGTTTPGTTTPDGTTTPEGTTTVLMVRLHQKTCEFITPTSPTGGGTRQDFKPTA